MDCIWDVVNGPSLLQDGTHTYVYGLGLIAIYDGSEMTYRLVDGLGSTVNLADEDGELVGEYTYDAYGNERSQSGVETEFSFAGEQNDPNGLDYLRARYYDSEIGRFLGRDPAGQGANLYSYALNDPINLSDPSGKVAAGTCLTYSYAAQSWLGCTSADAVSLRGDKWYESQYNEPDYTYVLTGEGIGRVIPLFDQSGGDTLFQLTVNVWVNETVGIVGFQALGGTQNNLFEASTVFGMPDLRWTLDEKSSFVDCNISDACWAYGVYRTKNFGGNSVGIFVEVTETGGASIQCRYGIIRDGPNAHLIAIHNERNYCERIDW